MRINLFGDSFLPMSKVTFFTILPISGGSFVRVFREKMVYATFCY